MRSARVYVARLRRFWSRWFWSCCLHDWTLTYGREPQLRICKRCRCVAVKRWHFYWKLLRRKDRSLVYWYGPHKPSGEPFNLERHEPLGPAWAGGWGGVERNERKIAEATT